MTVTEKLLGELNALRGLSYPEIGYCYFADIRGDGNNWKNVYQVVNAAGGVAYAYDLNAQGSRERCQKIRAAIATAKVTK